MVEKLRVDDKEWLRRLTPEQFRVCRGHGTERPFTGAYNDFKGKGVFKCAACGTELFDSGAKFDSGCGWPSFYAPLDESAVDSHQDISHGMVRTEVTCSNCGGHLGHVFPDGPRPTGDRYCINSVSLKFDEKKGV